MGEAPKGGVKLRKEGKTRKKVKKLLTGRATERERERELSPVSEVCVAVMAVFVGRHGCCEPCRKGEANEGEEGSEREGKRRWPFVGKRFCVDRQVREASWS